VLLPPGMQQWAMALRSRTDFADYTNAASDVFYNFVEPSTENIIGDLLEWKRSRELDDFAARLVAYQKALKKLQLRLDNSSKLQNANQGDTEVVDGHAVRHLGANVIAFELHDNPLEDQDVSKAGSTVLSRSNFRNIVEKTSDILKTGDSVFVIGQPGEKLWQP
jgi:hypothetical protein